MKGIRGALAGNPLVALFTCEWRRAGGRLADVAAPFPLWVKALAAASAFLPLLNLAVASLAAFLFGQTLCRGRWLLAGLAMLGLVWVTARLQLWEPVRLVFGLFPDVDLGPYVHRSPLGPGVGDSPEPETPCVLDLGWIFLNVAGLAILLALVALLWDRRAEV